MLPTDHIVTSLPEPSGGIEILLYIGDDFATDSANMPTGAIYKLQRRNLVKVYEEDANALMDTGNFLDREGVAAMYAPQSPPAASVDADSDAADAEPVVDLKSKNKKELVALAKEAGVSTSGTKADLIARLSED